MNAESGRKGLPQGKAHQLASRYQAVNPKNTHASNIIQAEQDVCMQSEKYIYNTHTHKCNNN